jgi:hypothetical protein
MRLHAALVIVAVALTGCATELATGFSDDGNWKVAESPHFIFHYRSGSDAERDLARIVVAAEQDYLAVTTILDVQFNAVINYYIYRHDEGNALGLNSTAHADTRIFTIYQPYDSDYPSAGSLGRHEMVHVIAQHALGRVQLPVLSEGLAVAVEGRFGSAPVDAWTRMACDNDALLSVRAMLDHPDDYPDLQFYPQAGSFVGYLLKRYGPAPLKRLYPVSYDAFDSEFTRLFGQTLEDVEREYRSSACSAR